MRLPANRNELVLFDINRNAAIKSTLLVSDPAPLTDRMMADENLPFAVTLVTNENPHSATVVARYKAPFSLAKSDVESLGLAWPRGVVSLSHVALAFPPDDPLYGRVPPAADDLVFLGNLAITGERGLVSIPADWLLRQRYNPFYPYSANPRPALARRRRCRRDREDRTENPDVEIAAAHPLGLMRSR